MIILLLNNFIESQILIVFSFALRFSFSAIIERFGASFVTELGALQIFLISTSSFPRLHNENNTTLLILQLLVQRPEHKFRQFGNLPPVCGSETQKSVKTSGFLVLMSEISFILQHKL